jgi:hypothetical protein
MGDSGTDAPADAAAQGNAAGRRRQRPQEVQEVVDELTIETKRVTLLDRVESQLKGAFHVSRLLFAFGVSDDRKIQSAVDQEFLDWMGKQGYAHKISGILLYIGQAGIVLLEGPTELLHKALEFFNSLTIEVPAKEDNVPGAASGPRNALISAIRVLHFTELHGVRVSTSWCSYNHGSKLLGSQSATLEEGNASELVFVVYQKLLNTCLKVSDAIGEDEQISFESLQGCYRKQAEMLPSADDSLILLSKNGADLFFSFAEFDKVFIAPFHCVLHSELLWPMPPALTY